MELVMTIPYFFGVLATAFGLYLFIEHQRYLQKGVKIPGKVYGYEHMTLGGSEAAFPVIEFVDGDSLYRFRSNSGNLEIPIGEYVDVYVLDSEAGRVRLMQSGRNIYAFIIFAVGLLFMGIFSVFLLEHTMLTKGGLLLIPVVTMLLLKFTSDRVAVNKVNGENTTSSGQENSMSTLQDSDIDRSQIAPKGNSFAPDAYRYLILFGAIFLAAGIYWTYKTINLSSHGLKAIGIVTDVRVKKNGYDTYVQYTAQNGHSSLFIDSSSGWTEGSTVNVIYDPNDLKNASIDTGHGVSLGAPIFMDLVAFGILIIGLILYRKRKQ